MRLASLVGLVLSLGLVACYPSNDALRDRLLTRARFDFQCEQIQLHPLDEDSRSYGVTGCNQRATYVLNYTTATWVMNVKDGQPTGGSPEEAPPTAPAPPPPPPPLK